MTDAHCHAARGESRHFLCDPRAGGEAGPDDVVFRGCHPWSAATFDAGRLRAALEADPRLGVGEIGLDRLKDKNISPAMRRVFEAQLEIAASFGRPVVLHGAKCWGEVVKAAKRYAGAIPAFLFHGFSRSAGLLGEIEAMNGFVSVGPALLNDYAVNYRELAKSIPERMLLAESDAGDDPAAPRVAEVARRLACLRGADTAEFAEILESNAARFAGALAAPSARLHPDCAV